jgi:hypothetical protein
MYRVMAIANYEDRFVIPTTHREYAENAFNVRGGCGFSFGNGCSRASPRPACSAARRSAPSRSRRRSEHEPVHFPRKSAYTCACWRTCCATRTPRCAPTCRTATRCAPSARWAPRLAELDALIGACGRRRWSARPSTWSCSTAAARTALHLFEHVHGDARPRPGDDRPGADLRGRPGLYLAPASCPTTCRWCWSSPPRSRRSQARAFLREMAHILRAIFSALLQRGRAPTPACWPRCSTWPARRPRP